MIDLETASQFFNIISTVLIVFLLAVQSWVLYKLLPYIRHIADNSDQVSKFAPEKLNVFNPLTTDNLNLKCTNRNDPTHIHTTECFN